MTTVRQIALEACLQHATELVEATGEDEMVIALTRLTAAVGAVSVADDVEIVGPGEVFCVRSSTIPTEALAELAAYTGSIVVRLDDGEDLEALSEDDMARHGWVRKPSLLLPPSYRRR